MCRLGAPQTKAGLLPALLNYYKSNVAQALIDHYARTKLDVVEMYTDIVSDLQVRATTRAFSKAPLEGGVPKKDIFRYRISLPIKALDAVLRPSQKEDKAIREFLVPFASFVKGEEVTWGTTDITQFRHLTEDAKIEIVEDPYWVNLMDTAAVLRTIEEEDGVIDVLKQVTTDVENIEP
jgi:hypothetical protein